MYEVDASAAAKALSSSGSLVFTPGAIDLILALATNEHGTIAFEQIAPSNGTTVTVPSGTGIAFVSPATTPSSHSVSTDTPVVVFQGSGGVDVIIGGSAGIDPPRVVVGTAGNDHLVIGDGRDSHILLGTGHSTVVGGTGNDTIVAGLGHATVDGGGGHDVVVLRGTSSQYTVTPGSSGSAPHAASQALAQSAGQAHVVVTNNVTHVTTDITGVQYVQLDNSDALIFAASTVEAGVASLYHAAFNRTGEFGGIDFWFDLAKQGLSLHDIAVGFTNSAEFQSHQGSLTDLQFISSLYQATFNRAADSGGLVYWLQQLNSGATRADLLTAFATVAALNDAGLIHTEATVVGSVTIIPNIV